MNVLDVKISGKPADRTEQYLQSVIQQADQRVKGDGLQPKSMGCGP